MDLSQTIEKAVAVVGSQRKLAELVGVHEQNISGYKKGRPCSYQMQAQIAAVAGLEDLALRILIEGMADTLNDEVAHEAQAKAGLKAMLDAFPRT